MIKKIYEPSLKRLVSLMKGIRNTRMTSRIKIICLIQMNMRYERIAIDKNLDLHPYIIVNDVIRDTINMFNNLIQIIDIESNERIIKGTSVNHDNQHKDLWNEIWNKYNSVNYYNKLILYENRIKDNDILELIKGKSVADLGCGHGTFSLAASRLGARSVTGVDFSSNSIRYANDKVKQYNTHNVRLVEGSLYELPFYDGSVDFAIQNGVFHHADDEEKCLSEAARILKKDGYMWYYTIGKGSIVQELFEASRQILEDISIQDIREVLVLLNISENKCYYLSDHFKAKYKCHDMDSIKKLLSKYGFEVVRRLEGGMWYDQDGDNLKQRYAKEKFGCGDLRLLCRLKNRKCKR